MEISDQIWEHWRYCERSHCLHEGGGADTCQGCELPESTPVLQHEQRQRPCPILRLGQLYQGIMRIITWLGNEDSIGRSRRFNEAMVAGAIIEHHFGSWHDLDVEFLLQLASSLSRTVSLR